MSYSRAVRKFERNFLLNSQNEVKLHPKQQRKTMEWKFNWRGVDLADLAALIGPTRAKEIYCVYGKRTIEEVNELSDAQLLKCRNIGFQVIKKIRYEAERNTEKSDNLRPIYEDLVKLIKKASGPHGAAIDILCYFKVKKRDKPVQVDLTI